MLRTGMNRTLTGTALSLALAALLSAAPAKAQTNDPNVSGSDRSVNGTTSDHRGFDAGWLGLIGLFGLMGKKGVRHDERYRRTEARTMPT